MRIVVLITILGPNPIKTRATGGHSYTIDYCVNNAMIKAKRRAGRIG